MMALLVVGLSAGERVQADPLSITTYASVSDPMQLSFAPDGTLFVGRDNSGSTNSVNASADPVKIHRVGPSGTPVTEYGNTAIDDPDGVVFDAAGLVSGIPGSVLVAGFTWSGGRISAISTNQSVVTLFGPSSVFTNPQTTKFDRTGRLLFLEVSGQMGVWVSVGGPPSLLLSLPGNVRPYHFAVGADNTLYVSDEFGVLRKYASNGTLLNSSLATGLTNFVFDVSSGGFPGTNLWGVDATGRLLEVNPETGAVSERASGLGAECRDTVFGPGGDIYISQFNHDRILRVSPDCASLPPGVVAWWRGEENALDGIGANHGALTGGVAFAEGRAGRCFAFDGATGFLTVSNTPGLDFGTNDFTILGWFNFDSLTQDQTFLDKSVGSFPNAKEFFLEYNIPSGALTNVLRFVVRNTTANENDLRVSVSLQAGTWYHLAAVRQGNTSRLYLDGQLLGGQTAGNNVDTGAGGVVILGRLVEVAARFFDGRLDEFALFNRALSDGEILGAAQGCPGSLQINPATTNIAASATASFTATGGTAPYVFTLVTNSSGASITTNGVYTAGPGCGTDTVRVRDSLNASVLALVNVLDLTVPAITCPSNRIIEATSPSGSVVTFAPTATDNCTISPTLISTPPSGNGFPIGTNLVTCRAIDAAGNSNSCTFTVTVRDTTPPTISCPANISVQTTNPAGTAVNFAPSATDVADALPSIVCVPAAGSIFAPGTTLVTCTAVDGAGNTNSCTFTVTVSVIPTAFAVYGRVAASNGLGVAGVDMTLTGGSVNASTTTDGIGAFRFDSVGAGSYTLQAARVNHSFAASPLSVTVTSAEVRQDFTATRTAIQISGRMTNCVTGESIPNAKVSVTGVRRPVLTDAGGYYVFPSVPLRSTITVAASLPSATVTPGLLRLLSATNDRVANFCARRHWDISGSVRDTNGLGIPSATVIMSGNATNYATTDLAGNYVFRDVPSGILNVAATNWGHTFAPTMMSFTNLATNGIAVFTGTVRTNYSSKLAVTQASTPSGSSGGTTIFDLSSGTFVKFWGYNRIDAEHSWSPDGRRIAFLRAGELRMMNPDGSGFTTIPDTLSNVRGPVFSPDGSKLAYHTFQQGSGYSLFVMNTNGSERTPVNSEASQFSYSLHSWSPSGGQLVFFHRSASFDLSLVNLNGTGLHQLTTNGMHPGNPTWSPDGSSIAGWVSGSPKRVQLINPTNGLVMRQITNAFKPCFSPDGSMLAFMRRPITSASDAGVAWTDWDVRIMPLAGGEETLIASGFISSFAWGKQATLPTSTGTNVRVELGNVSVTFSNVISAGTTVIDRRMVDLANQGYVNFVAGGVAYDIHTTASFGGPVVLCFTVPEPQPQIFATLRILHAEQNPTNGVMTFVDRTILAPDSPAPDFATKTICARVNSLSPFLIVAAIDPGLPQITGTVVDENGLPLVGAQVTLTGERESTAETDVQGGFLFVNLITNGNYTVSVAKGGYLFDPISEEIPDLGTGADLLFVGAVAPPTPVPALAISNDARFGGLPTLTWPGHPLEFELETTDSLNVTNWFPALESPIPTESGVAVPLAPAGPERYYRLRRP